MGDPAGSDGYLSVETGPQVEIKVKASRFIGQVLRAASGEDARALLQVVRRTYHDARHHVSAWRLAPADSPTERSDDDGEPSGTAGPPLLEALRHERILDALLVVTRYFGGTKLGKGGLVRAYGEAGREALAAAPRRTVWCDVTIAFSCGYGDVGSVEAVLARLGAPIQLVERDFAESPTFRILIRRSAENELRAALVEATAARLRWLPA